MSIEHLINLSIVSSVCWSVFCRARRMDANTPRRLKVQHGLVLVLVFNALKRLHTREVFLPPALALAIVIELLEALQIAHTAGVVHGALTPGNIVIADAGYAVITDFGALEALRASPALRAMFSNQGRSSYRAPELKGTTAATESSDLYSMGAICYELLTLHEASTGGAAVSTRQEKLPPPSRLARRLNSRIDGAVMRALEASPARRFKSCSEFAEALRDAAAANGGFSVGSGDGHGPVHHFHALWSTGQAPKA